MDDNIGVLVGWTSHDLGSRLALKLESVTTPPPHSPEDVHSQMFLMDKNQAVQLGYYLFRVAEQSAPIKRRKKGLLGRLFGA